MVNAREQASEALGKLGGVLGGLATAAAGLAAGAVAGVGALGSAIANLAMEAAPVEQVRQAFDALTTSIGETSTAMLESLRTATNGMVSDADLMRSANQMISMGLADSTESAANLAEMAVRLGGAMGNDAVASLENFSLMLANQSIPRLDSFGISAAAVRERMEELTTGTNALTREEAFLQAVSEQGAVALNRLGTAGTQGAAVSMAQLKATIENLKLELGTAFLPILDSVLGVLGELAREYGPLVAEWAGQLAEVLAGSLGPMLEMVVGLVDELLPPLMQTVGEVLPTLLPLVGELIGALGPLVGTLAAALIPALTEIAAALLPALLPLVGTLAGAFVQVLDAVLPLAVTLLETLIPPFVQILNAILPALTPLLTALAEVFVEVVTAVLPLVQVLLEQLLPIFTDLIATLLPPLTDLLILLIGIFADLLAAIVPVVAELIEQLAPILAEVAGVIAEALNVALTALSTLIENNVGPALDWLRSSVLEPLRGAFQGISDAVSGVIGWLGGLRDGLQNISLPSWLTPGSPTPFELGLRGIADALHDLPVLEIQAAVSGAGGALGGAAPNPAERRGTMVVNIYPQQSLNSVYQDLQIIEALL